MKRFSFTLVLLVLIFACGSDPIPAPGAVVLQAPENLNTCTTAQSTNSSQSRVTFSWVEANNTDSYDLVVRNETTGQETSNNEVIIFESSMVLNKGAAYSWWVNSKSEASTEITKSTVWSFYLEGTETPSYIPFPAFLVDPAENQTIDISGSQNYTFEWQGNDLDSDIDYFSLRLGTDANDLTTVASNINGSTTSVTLQPATTYFWQVITVDSEGSSSASEIGVFSTL